MLFIYLQGTIISRWHLNCAQVDIQLLLKHYFLCNFFYLCLNHSMYISYFYAILFCSNVAQHLALYCTNTSHKFRVSMQDYVQPVQLFCLFNFVIILCYLFSTAASGRMCKLSALLYKKALNENICTPVHSCNYQVSQSYGNSVTMHKIMQIQFKSFSSCSH